MSDVGFGMELVFPVNTTLNLPGFESGNNCRNALDDVVFFLFIFDAFVQPLRDFCKSICKSLFRAFRNLISHQDSYFRDGLPSAVKREQTTHFKETSCHVNGLRKLTPLFKITMNFSVRIAVIDNKKI